MEASVFVFRLIYRVSFCSLFFLGSTLNGYSYVSIYDYHSCLLPDDHPIKPTLDKIFSEARVCLSIKTMKKAGFIDPYPRKFTRLVFTRHPLLKGYVIKLYLHAQRLYKNQTELDHWLKRIQGAYLIKEYIQKNKLEHIFKVPQKWIYCLPDPLLIPSEYIPKNYILVVEDMDLTSKKKNKDMWSSELVSCHLLNYLYDILYEIGLHDCGSIDNIPFSEDGLIAFIDTESFGEWPVNFKKLTPFLSEEMKNYWNKIIKTKKLSQK